MSLHPRLRCNLANRTFRCNKFRCCCCSHSGIKPVKHLNGTSNPFRIPSGHKHLRKRPNNDNNMPNILNGPLPRIKHNNLIRMPCHILLSRLTRQLSIMALLTPNSNILQCICYQWSKWLYPYKQPTSLASPHTHSHHHNSEYVGIRSPHNIPWADWAYSWLRPAFRRGEVVGSF